MNMREKWEKFSKGFISFVNVALLVLLLFIVVGTYQTLKRSSGQFSSVDIIFILITVLIGLAIYFMKKKKVKSKNIVIFLILIGFIIRIVWVLSIDSVPISDYNGVYRAGYSALQGDFSEFKGFGYYARFPHLTVPVFFASLMYLFPVNVLIAAKIVNCIFSSLGILAIYLLCKQIFKKNVYGEIAAFIMALYPPIILYTAVYCNENQAIPFYIFSLYLFLKYINEDKKYIGIFLAGATLSIGNLFRMVATIVVVAFLLYIAICGKDNIKERIKKAVIVVVGFMVPLVTLSFGLRAIGITEQNLWAGSEPKITNILKGTNVEHGGGWNPEDAAIPEKYNFDKEKIEEACKEIIWSRLTETDPKALIDFYVKKYTGIWSNGEFSGAYWAEHSIEESDITVRISQNGIWYIRLVYFMIMVLVYVGLFNTKAFSKFKEINLLYFIFCGYGIMFLITERQDRYTFIVCWIFIILAMNGVNLIEKKLGESKWKSLD